jgi:hypothetical protein
LLYLAAVKAAAKADASYTASSAASLETQVFDAACSLCCSIEMKKNSEKQTKKKGSIILLMYFSEVDLFSEPGKIVDDHSLYHIFCCMLNTLKTLSIFRFFLSMTFSVAKFAPPGHLHPACIHRIKLLQALFTELLFDCLLDGKPFFMSGMTLNDVSTMCSYSLDLKPPTLALVGTHLT